jgi:hypothetical protein
MHLLVKAVNSCIEPFASGSTKPFSADDYKQLASEQDLWSSSCIVALEKDKEDVVAVILGCKRAEQTFLLGAGIREDQAAGSHLPAMLESLHSKFAILGPPTLRAEVSAGDSVALGLFKEAQYQIKAGFSDWIFESSSSNAAAENEQLPIDAIGIDDLLELNLLDLTKQRSWYRSIKSLRNSSERIKGLGIVGSDTIESFILYRQYNEAVQLLDFGAATDRRFLKVLFNHFCALDHKSIKLLRLTQEELQQLEPQTYGFSLAEEYLTFVGSVTEGKSVAQFAPQVRPEYDFEK